MSKNTIENKLFVDKKNITTKPQTILIIGGGWEQYPLVETAKNRDLYIVLTDSTHNCMAKPLADVFIQVDPRDLMTLLDIANQHQVQGVIADECDYSHYAASYIAQKLGLAGDGLLPAQLTTNKAWMRNAVRNTDVMQPRFFPCISLDEAKKAINLIGFPVIVKPVDNRGAFGVNIVNDYSELEAAFLEALINAHSRQVIVEALIAGTHITVDGVFDEKGIHHNLAIASKKIQDGERPVITEVVYPAEISNDWSDHVFMVNHRVVEALQITSGFTHSEYIIDDRGRCFLVETANRGGGVLTSAKILPHLAGANLYDFLLDKALGLPTHLTLNRSHDTVVLTFFTFDEGLVKSIEGDVKARALKGVLHFQLLIRAGQTIKQPQNGAERHGFAILVADNRVNIEKIREEMLSLVRINYENH